MVKFSFLMAILLSMQCGFMKAADNSSGLVFELALRRDPLLDHAVVYALSLVNKNLFNCVSAAKDARKVFLMALVEKQRAKIFSDSMSSKFKEAVYFHRYGSLCIYLTKENEIVDGFNSTCALYCNWAYVKDGKTHAVSGKKPLMKIDLFVDINVGVFWDTNIPHVFNGEFGYYGINNKEGPFFAKSKSLKRPFLVKSGHGIKGPFFAQDGTEFSFFYRPDYFDAKKGTKITFVLDGAEEKREPCEDVEVCIAAYQLKEK